MRGGSFDEARGWLQQGLAAYHGEDDRLRAKSLLAAALAAFNGADVQEAQALTEQSLDDRVGRQRPRAHARANPDGGTGDAAR